MTPKQEADELYHKLHFALPSYSDEGQQEHEAAKKCALIAIDKIIKVAYFESVKDYWKEVKLEIENL